MSRVGQGLFGVSSRYCAEGSLPELFRETAKRIPNGHLMLYEGRSRQGTFTDRRFAGDVITLLGASSR